MHRVVDKLHATAVWLRRAFIIAGTKFGYNNFISCMNDTLYSVQILRHELLF